MPGQLPRTRAVDRVEYLRSIARGRSVIHIGFVGLGMDEDGRNRRPWLHGELAGVASRLVGLDLDAAGVEKARLRGYDAHVADCRDPSQLASLDLTRAQVVVAGEVIEHLEAPGSFLDAVHLLVEPGGRLVITTPNAASLLNPLAAMSRLEVVHPDHVAIYSWYTLTNLLSRHRWRAVDFATYHRPPPTGLETSTVPMNLGRLLTRVQRAASRFWPFLDFGLIAVSSEA